MFAQDGLFMKQNAYVPEGGNEGESVATPYQHFNIWFLFKFGHDIVNGFNLFS